MKKQDYNCVLYEPGDKVVERYGSDEIFEIESTELKYIGIFPCLFLKFKGVSYDSTKFSNLFIPAAETIEKYKDGLKYFNEVTVTNKIEKRIKSSVTFKKPKQSNVLTEEDLKPKVITKGFFKHN